MVVKSPSLLKWAYLKFLFLLLILSGCAVFRAETVEKIVLLAPFEGRYREIGYDALYSARLALSESNLSELDLLAIDDGGSIETAIARANAIRQDSSIKAVLLLGVYASDEAVQLALDTIPSLIVGYWGNVPSGANAFILANSQIPNLINWQGEVTSIPETGEIISAEILSLHQVALLQEDISRLEIYSSSLLPDENFHERFINSGLYVPEPNLLATLSYDATALLIQSLRTKTPLAEIRYEGFNGLIRFENTYWQDAPIYHYGYDEAGELFRLP